MTLDDFLKKCEEIEAKATEANWTLGIEGDNVYVFCEDYQAFRDSEDEPNSLICYFNRLNWMNVENSENDAAFIAHARNTYPLLLKMLRVAYKALEYIEWSGGKGIQEETAHNALADINECIWFYKFNRG